MSAQYYLNIISHFCSSHVIPNHPGKCARLHGHNYKLITEVSAPELDDMGMVIEKKAFSDQVDLIVERIDHRHINDMPEFKHRIPTAEAIAQWLYSEIKTNLPARLTLKSVTLWETPSFFVRYTDD